MVYRVRNALSRMPRLSTPWQNLTAPEAAAAERLAGRETSKYILPSYCFVSLTFETLGPISQDGLTLIKRLGHRLAQSSGDNRETIFLFQRLSVTMPTHKQALWYRPLLQQTFKTLLQDTADPYNTARLKAVSSPHASDWLY